MASASCAAFRTFGDILILKQRGNVRQIGSSEFCDQRPVLVDDDEDPTRIMLAETQENGILIRFVRNKGRLQTVHPKFCNQRNCLHCRSIMGTFWKSQVFQPAFWNFMKL